MGVITKIALRNMKRRKTRYILTIITLVLSVALFGGVMIVSDSFSAMLLDGMDSQMGSADILVKPVNGTDVWFAPDEINNEIDSLSHVDAISYRIVGFSIYLSSTDSGNQIDNSTRTLVFGINHTAKDEKKLGGRPFILDSVSDEETYEGLLEYEDGVNGNRVIVITEALKIKLGTNFTAGDTVWIFPNEGEDLGYDSNDIGTWIAYTVVAVVRDTSEARDFDPEAPSDGYSSAQGPALFSSIVNAHELVDGTLDHTGEYTLGAIGVDHIKRIAAVVLELDEILEALDDEDDWSLLDVKSDNLEMISQTMDMMEIMFMMFGLIALILSMILIMNVFNIIKKEQEYETGIFQAIGASKSETFRLFLTQGVVMGLIGAVIGTISSYFISYVIFSVTVDTLQSLSIAEGFVPDSFQIILLPQTIITTFVVGFGACIVASLYPSWKASRKPIIECLSPLEEKTTREKKHYIKRAISYIIGSLIIGVGVWLILTPSSDSGFGGGFGNGGGFGGGNLNAFLGPTLVLLGIIWLLSLLLKYVNKVFVFLFIPYLRRTKLLTEKNILRHPKRTVLTFAMIALTTSFLIGMSIMMDSMREGVNTTVYNFVGADARIYTYNTPRSFEDDLITQPGIEDVMGVSHQNARIQIEGEWIGHGSLDSDYNISISTNVIDPGDVKDHISKIPVISPSAMTSDDLMDVLASGNNVIIEKSLADDYNIKAGDVLPIDFSLGLTLANLTAMINVDFYNAHEDTIIINMSVVGIVETIPGFSTIDLLGGFGGGGVTTYNIYIAWTIYEEIASQNLPGGGTDMVFRQLTQTGNPLLDISQPNWFNFSFVEALINGIDEIDYYTTRMDSYTFTDNGNSTTDYMASVVGIQTNSSGKLKSDSLFGNNILVDQKNGYLGTTMEELLNTTEYVVVVDELYIKNHNGSRIGTNITIFPQEFALKTIPVGFSPYSAVVNPYLNNYTSLSGTAINLFLSDDVDLSFISNQEWLAFNITTSFQTPFLYKAINVTIETSLNSSVDQLELEAFNIYTNEFEKLGSINNTVELSNTFLFDSNHHYIDPIGNLILRIRGHNSTYNSNYNLTIDSLKFGVAESTYMLIPATWPQFEIIGIIKAPTFNNTERYTWYAGFETGFDVGGNTVYMSYEKARDIVYVDSNDKITSVLLHSDNPKNISSITELVLTGLSNEAGNWTIIDIKSLSLEIRTFAYDWFVWVEAGVGDEEVLETVLDFIESEKYLVLFSFTRTFMASNFKTILNMIVFIMNGLLLFAIIIAMIGLTLHSLLTTMSRRREIGMLRSIGLSKKGVIRSISGETIILALLGVFGGIFAGFVQGSLMVNNLPGGGFLSVTWTIPWLTIIILVSATLLTTIISSRYPAKWAANLNIIDAVRTR